VLQKTFFSKKIEDHNSVNEHNQLKSIIHYSKTRWGSYINSLGEKLNNSVEYTMSDTKWSIVDEILSFMVHLTELIFELEREDLCVLDIRYLVKFFLDEENSYYSALY